jgi:PAS domain S-box-containing protein
MLAVMQGPTPPGQSDVRLRLALDAAELGTWYWDAATGVTVWDRQMRRIFGVGPDWPGTYDAYVAALHPLDREQVLAALGAAVAAGERYVIDHRILRPDGTVRWIEGIGQVLTGDDGEALGSIGCARDITQRVERDQQLAGSLAAQAELAEQARAAVRRTEALQRVTALFAAALTLDDVIAIIGESLPDAVGAARIGLALRTPDRSAVRFLAVFGHPGEVPDSLRLQTLDADLPVPLALREQTALFLTAAELRARFPALAAHDERAGNASLVVTPLVAGDETLGALTWGFTAEQPFDADQRAFVEAVSAQAAQAVARSLLVGQLREVSRELQAGLAPGDLPQVEGLDVAADYRAGGDEVESIGGDWFDVVPLDGGGAVIVVGDVMGRGVRAATTMTRLRASVRAFLCEDDDPAALLTRLDRLVVREGLQDFVTLLVVRLDAVTGALTAVNAGHLQPVVVGALPDDHAVAGPLRVAAHLLAVPPGPPLGLPDGPRTATSAHLPAGATLLLFTDGLVERRDRDIDGGLDLVVDVAAREHGTVGDLVADVVATLAAHPGDDDVTVLAVRRLAPATPLPAAAVPVRRGEILASGVAGHRAPGSPRPPSP